MGSEEYTGQPYDGEYIDEEYGYGEAAAVEEEEDPST